MIWRIESRAFEKLVSVGGDQSLGIDGGSVGLGLEVRLRVGFLLRVGVGKWRRRLGLAVLRGCGGNCVVSCVNCLCDVDGGASSCSTPLGGGGVGCSTSVL